MSETQTNRPQEIDALEEEYDETDYTPNFIQKMLANPEMLPYGSEADFESIFEEIEFNHLGRAKTTHEYILVNEATKLITSLRQLERIEKTIIANQRRPVVEAWFRKSMGVSASLSADKYFFDPKFRKLADQEFEAAGYAPDAIEGEAYLRALPSLTILHRQKAADRKALIGILKELESRFSSRDREKKMSVKRPRSKSSESEVD
jgi:hypothetical protein